MTGTRPSSFVTNVVNGVPHLAVVVEIDRDWQAEHRLVVQAGRVVVAETRVYPRRWTEDPTRSEEQAGAAAEAPTRGLTTTRLRGVTVGAPINDFVKMFQSLRESARTSGGASVVRVDMGRGTREKFNIAEDDFLSSSPALRALVNLDWRPRKPSSVARPGRRPLSDDVLIEAAAAYIAARKRGSAQPVPDAAKALKTTEARMRDLVYRARQRGILTPTGQGRGGGELTPGAKRQLARLKRRSGGKKRR